MGTRKQKILIPVYVGKCRTCGWIGHQHQSKVSFLFFFEKFLSEIRYIVLWVKAMRQRNEERPGPSEAFFTHTHPHTSTHMYPHIHTQIHTHMHTHTRLDLKNILRNIFVENS